MSHKWLFLCYRRQDSTVQAGRIFDVLNARFPDQVFQDVETIEIGVNWTDQLRESLLSADVLILVIGPEWQSMAMEHGPRINDPADYVHLEVRTALEHDLRIIPVLLQGAKMPQPGTLPPQLEGLLRRQAIPLHDGTFETDMARLVASLERVRKEIAAVRGRAALSSAERMRQELAARKVAAYAESTAVKPRNLPRAGLLALEAMMRFPLPGAHAVLRQARAGLPRLEALFVHASEIAVLAASSKGKWIATGSIEGDVKVWDSATMTLAVEFRTGGKVGALVFEPEERWLAAATGDCKVHVWELPAGRFRAVLDTRQPLIKLLVQSDSSTTSLVGLSREFSNGDLIVWDANDWKLLWKQGMITDVAGQAQQQVIAVASGDHVIVALTTSGQMLQKFHLQATVTGVAWHLAYQLFAATTREGALWRGFLAPAGEGKVQWQCERLKGYASPVAPLAFSPNAAWLALADGNGLCVMNLEDLSTLSLPLKGQFGFQFAFSRQGTFLAALSPENHSLAVWRLPVGRLVVDMHLETAFAVCFDMQESRMISASHENTARVWNLPTGEAPLWGRNLGATAELAFSPRGDFVAWVGKEVAPNRLVQTNSWKLAVMRAPDGEIAFSTVFEGLAGSVAFDSDSRWIALRSGVIRVFDLRTGEESPAMAKSAEAWFPGPPSPDIPLLESLSERETLQSLWSATRKWLVTHHPGRLRIWDGTTQSELAEFSIPTGITGISISPSEKYLAIGGGDGDLQIRTLTDGIEIAVFPHDGAVTKFAFSPDGNFVVAAGVDTFAIQMWIVSPEILMEDVRRRLDRDLTREEWELYIGDEPYSETRLAASMRVRENRTR
jgi:WD40 repeat protein